MTRKEGTHTQGEQSIGLLGGQAGKRAIALGRKEGGRRTIGASGQTKGPLGLPRGLGGAWDYLPLPARALRINRKVNNRQSPRYPRTRKRGFISSRVRSLRMAGVQLRKRYCRRSPERSPGRKASGPLAGARGACPFRKGRVLSNSPCSNLL